MFTSNQDPSILECLLADGRKAKGVYAVLHAFNLKIALVKNRVGFEIMPKEEA